MPAQLYRELGRLGLNTGASGNVSVRTATGMRITPSGVTAETATEDTLVEMGLDGPDPGQNPSSEWAMHAAIYRSAPEAGCVVHTHSDACTALSCLGEGLPAFHYMVASFGGDDVPCAPYVTFGTTDLACVVALAMEGRSACLLANHGMTVHGPDRAAALGAAVRLETLARQYLLARGAGRPVILTEAQMDAARARFRTYGRAAR
jgi:L-fuculose-phosphate aldolase